MNATRKAVVLNDTRVDGHHGCTRVMRTLEHCLARAGYRVLATAPAHADWRDDAAVMRALDAAHLLVVNGEGTLHHDRPAGRALLAAGGYARERGTPAVLLNALWQDNDAAAVDAARAFALVAARDGRSAAQLRDAGVPCELVPDLSLYLPAPARTQARRGIGVTDSVLRGDALALDALRRSLDAMPVPIQVPTSARRWLRAPLARDDLARPATLARRVRERLAHWQARLPDDEAFVDALGRLELLVSGRFHACTLALLARTPFVAVASNSHKIQALVEDAGLAGWRVAPSVDALDVARAAREGWSPREAAAIDAYLADARARTDALFARIGGLA